VGGGDRISEAHIGTFICFSLSHGSPAPVRRYILELWRRASLHGQSIGKPLSDAVREARPFVCEMRLQFGMQHLVKEAKPDREVLGFDVACRLVFLHRIARIGPLAQDGVAPEACDFDLVFGPVVDVVGEDWAQIWVAPHGCVEFPDNRVDLVSSQHRFTPRLPKSGRAR